MLDDTIRRAVDPHGSDAQDVVNGFKWELYNITKDWTQNNDLAAKIPTSSRSCRILFWVEAEKYQVLPLDASVLTRVRHAATEHHRGTDEFTYTRPVTGILPGNEPNILDKSYVVTAEIPFRRTAATECS